MYWPKTPILSSLGTELNLPTWSNQLNKIFKMIKRYWVTKWSNGFSNVLTFFMIFLQCNATTCFKRHEVFQITFSISKYNFLETEWLQNNFIFVIDFVHKLRNAFLTSFVLFRAILRRINVVCRRFIIFVLKVTSFSMNSLTIFSWFVKVTRNI